MRLGALLPALLVAVLSTGADVDAQDARESLEARLAELDAGEDPAAQRALETLTRLGDDAVARALRDFAQQSHVARRARADLLVALPLPAHCARVAELARDDPDPAVRRTLAELLGDPALAEACAAERVAVLDRLLRTDPSPHVRTAAREALKESGLDAAVAALERAIGELPAGEADRVAAAFAQQPAARERLVALVVRAFARESGQPWPAEVMGALLRNYGRALAEVPLGGDELAERLPFLLGRRDPSQEVATAARVALAAFVARASELDEVERAERVLARLGDEGWPRVDCLRRRIDLAWAERGDAAQALVLARELAREAMALGPEEGRLWEVHARLLEGAALFALDLRDEARALFEDLATRLDESTAVREDLFPVPVRPDPRRGGGGGRDDRWVDWRSSGGEAYGNRLLLGATVRLWLALLELQAGDDEVTVLETLRVAHLEFLEARLAAMRTGAQDPGTLDAILHGNLAPLTLVLGNEELAPERRDAFLDLALALARAFGRVAPLELPGLEGDAPRPELGEVLVDPERLDRLLEMRETQFKDLQRRLQEGDDGLPRDQREHLQRVLRAQQAELMRVVREEMDELYGARRGAHTVEELKRIRVQLLDYLSPSLHVHVLAGELRSEGRTAEARALCERALSTLAREPLGSALWVEYQSARLEMLLGSILMDAELPREAEESYRACERRLLAIEGQVREWRDTAGSPESERQAAAQLKQIREMRGEAWLSLAVNANVRLRDPSRALEYFERAYELNQNTFMQVLRACYRARSGKGAEARTVLRGVVPSPPLYYNIACTHALLGDRDEALDYLERDLAANHPTEGARRQKLEWMAGDPDLANLQGHPRFERMLEDVR